VREITRGNQYLSAKISERLQSSGRNIMDTPSDVYETLTAREREILQMTAEGRTSQEVGDKFTISPRTVEVHRSNLMNKLGLHNQTELIKFAIKRGIISLDD
jgi:two-component system, NarL family, response regulator NreC